MGWRTTTGSGMSGCTRWCPALVDGIADSKPRGAARTADGMVGEERRGSRVEVTKGKGRGGWEVTFLLIKMESCEKKMRKRENDM
jgi:hypothetical protein